SSVSPVLNRVIAFIAVLLIAAGLTAPVHAQEPMARMSDATTLDQLTTADDFYTEYATVLRLYKAFFDRNPDVVGAKYWIRIYREGNDVASIATAFEQSQEFRNRYGTPTNEQFLENLYQNVLGRPSDAAGFAYWLGLLNSGQLDRGGVVQYVAGDTEFTDNNRFAGEENAKPGADRGAPIIGFDRDVSTRGFRNYASSSTAAWRIYTNASDIRIPSTHDSYSQPAYWLPSDGQKRPLLVVLHSWSSNYNQQLNVSFTRWADRNDWAMIAPDFRGANDDPQATGSDLVIKDIKDAVNFALANDDIDPTKVFMIGFSGGGFAVLNMAGEAPELFAGGIAWVPVYDLPEWYAYRLTVPRRHYVGQLQASCGGAPLPGTAAFDECKRRSPSDTIANAKAANIPLYIATGLQDTLVPTSQSFKAFDALVPPEDQFGPAIYSEVDRGRLPADLLGQKSGFAWFDSQDRPLLMSRTSGNVTLALFQGTHESLYEPGLEWAAKTAWQLER
ncbi:MAG: alpha/beta fold hydrolase, partial [Acidimicrobiia bacterium]